MTGEWPRRLEVQATQGSVRSSRLGSLDQIDALYSCNIENVTGSKDNTCRVSSERDKTKTAVKYKQQEMTNHNRTNSILRHLTENLSEAIKEARIRLLAV